MSSPENFGDFVQIIAEEALNANVRDLPGLQYLTDNYLIPLRDGGTFIGAVRSQMLRRSPVCFVHQMPQLQVHHGTADPVVDVSQANRLIDVMDDAGFAEPEFEAYIYPGGTHNPILLLGSISRAVAFIERLLMPAKVRHT